TNITEALWLFTGAKSFRGAKDNEMVSFGFPEASLSMNFISGGIERFGEINIKQRRTASLDGKKLKTPSALAGNFCSIVFSPSDLEIIKDGPALRRRFMDIALGQLYPQYIEILKDYTKAVTERNALLKDSEGKPDTALLDVYEAQIANLGSKIIDYRKNYCEKITPHLAEIYSGLSGSNEELEAGYLPVCSADDLAEELLKSRKKDIYSGITSVGPHRDDFDFKINSVSARTFGSQGQQRSVAIALKLAEAKTLKLLTGEEPVAILDDVLSELDPGRQNYILNNINDRQIFITCCDPSNFKGLISGKVFNVTAGRVKQGG
ncbi:MAG: DNA replication/repair protein RecF, partial [Clostridia bacterium]|nr:DNA replication/repair protein RecF [Clostridia bacterium]